MSNQSCDLILQQHQIIRENSGKIIEQIDILRKDPSSSEVDLAQLEKEIRQVLKLIESHSLSEEQILLPILSQMYESQPEILEYVVEDHEVFQKELSALLNDSSPFQGKLSQIKALLNRVTVHFVEEENGLIPLVEMFLASTPTIAEK